MRNCAIWQGEPPDRLARFHRDTPTLWLAQSFLSVYFHVVPKSQWITTSSASQTSGIPKRTIIAAINRGDLAAQKLPGLTGAFLIDPADLHAWLAGRGRAA